MKRVKIEIIFPFPIELPKGFLPKIGEFLQGEICKPYEASHLDRVMWPCEFGSKMTYLPLTLEEEAVRGAEFDDSIFSIRICERRKTNGM